jgi:sugar phosphate isomerase/epimerase
MPHNTGVILYGFGDRPLAEQLDIVREIGYRSVEVPVHLVLNPEVDRPEAECGRIRQSVEDRDLRVAAVSAENDFVVLDTDDIKAQVSRTKRVGQLARLMGCNVLRMEGGVPKDSVPETKWADALVGCFERCLEFAVTDDLYLAMDNHGMVTNNPDIEIEVFERLHNRHVGACVDTSNYRWFGHGLNVVHRTLGRMVPYTLHTHLKDGDGSQGKLGDYQATALGEGEIDVATFINDLKMAGYNGCYCSEYEGAEPPEVGHAKNYEYIANALGA